MWNLARLFSYTRGLESKVAEPCAICTLKQERIDELKERIADLQRRLDRHQDYILFQNQKPPINRESTSSIEAQRPPVGIRGVRRAHLEKAIQANLDRMDKEGHNAHKNGSGSTMEERADAYAAQVNKS